MRKLLIGSAAVALTLALSACQPPAKEEADEVEAVEAVDTADKPVAEDTAKKDDAGTEADADDAADDADAAGTEHTGGPKVGQ